MATTLPSESIRSYSSLSDIKSENKLQTSDEDFQNTDISNFTDVSSSEFQSNEISETTSTISDENDSDSTIDDQVSTISDNKLVISTGTFSLLNPLSWFITKSETKIESVEKGILKNVKANKIERFFTLIHNKSYKIWTLSTNTESQNIPIVLVHGFCGAIGLWVHNIESLSVSRPLYAFDLLGFGRSSRASFSNDPIVAELQFVESIEDWRKQMKIDKMILLGHSFGAYISASYAIKYSNRVDKLLLADPWGFHEMPDTTKADIQDTFWIKLLASLSKNVSPFGLIRITGEIGVNIMKKIRPDLQRKFSSVIDDPELIYKYLHHANAPKPSGEAGFLAIAEHFGYAKNPMIKRIDKVDSSIPICFIHGSRSWLDSTVGFTAIHTCQNSSISVKLITGAGHHVYADKPQEFNEYVNYYLDTSEISDQSYDDINDMSFENDENNNNVNENN